MIQQYTTYYYTSIYTVKIVGVPAKEIIQKNTIITDTKIIGNKQETTEICKMGILKYISYVIKRRNYAK